MPKGLRPDLSLAGSLAIGGLVLAVYSRTLPPAADLRTAEAGDEDAEAARKQALWTSVGIVSVISLLTKDPTIAVTGYGLTIALDWTTRHAIWVNPFTGSAMGASRDDQSIPTQAEAPGTYGPARLEAI
jgi:hypothetical protein